MLVSIAAKICDALPAKKCEIPLNTSAHCTSAELAKFLAVLLAVENGFFQCISIPVLRNGRQAFKWQCCGDGCASGAVERSEEHTSELQSLMRISYAVFCLKKKTETNTKITS